MTTFDIVHFYVRSISLSAFCLSNNLILCVLSAISEKICLSEKLHLFTNHQDLFIFATF